MRGSGRVECGFSLLELLVALALFAVVTTGVARLATDAMRAVTRSRDRAVAVALAMERLEQLRGLEWGFGDAGSPVATSDVYTDLTVTPLQSGGSGLTEGPSDTLVSNIAGYFDFLNRDGRWISHTANEPPFFVRRWRVSAVAGFPDLLALQVVVISVGDRTPASVTGPDDVWFVTMKGRKAY